MKQPHYSVKRNTQKTDPEGKERIAWLYCGLLHITIVCSKMKRETGVLGYRNLYYFIKSILPTVEKSPSAMFTAHTRVITCFMDVIRGEGLHQNSVSHISL